MYLTNFGSRNRLKLVPRPCDARFPSYGPPSRNEAPHPQRMDPRAESMYVSDRVRHGLSFEGLYFSVRSRVRELWTKQVLDQYIKYRRARACAGGPPRARIPPHMTSEVMLSAFIRIYPRLSACGAPRLHRACDVTHPACTVCNSKTLLSLVTTHVRVLPLILIRTLNAFRS